MSLMFYKLCEMDKQADDDDDDPGDGTVAASDESSFTSSQWRVLTTQEKVSK